MKGLVEWFTRNPVAANLLMLLLMVGGALTVPTIKQEVFPEFSAEIVTASVVYPGAAPEEVEESICVKIEEEVYGVDGIKRVSSSATEGAGAVTIEVLPGYDPRRVLDDVKTRIDAIDTFPEDAEKPVIQELTLRKQVLFVAVSGPAQERVLHHLAERVRDDLAALDDVGQAELAAVRPYEVSIEVSEDALRRHGLTLREVAEAVRRSALDVPGGAVKTDSGEVLLRARGRAYIGAQFERLPLLTLPDGSRVDLGQVARVVDGYADTDQWARFDGDPAALVAVYRTGDQSALDVGGAVKQYVEQARATMPEGVALTIWKDDSRFLRDRLDTLLRNGRAGLLLVFLVLALFLRLRLAFWVTLGIPISFLGTLMLMPTLGASINMLSLFAFILVLGIVVDDAIVVGENVYTKQRQGLPPLQAAIEGAREVAVPVTFAVLTSVAAFAPMLGLPGLTGRIWRIIPLIVIPCLLFSLVESKLILPAHLAHGDRGQGRGARHGWTGLWARLQERFAEGLERFVRGVYRPFLERALEWRWLTAASAVAVLVLTGGLVGGGHVKLVFFPPVEGDNVVALLTMPQGTPAEVTARAVERIEAAALALAEEVDAEAPTDAAPVVEHMLASVGEQPYRTDQSRNGGRQGQTFVGAHLGEINLQLASSEVREVTAAEIARRWRERTGPVADAVELVFTSSLFSAGKPIDVQLGGNDLEALVAAAADLRAQLAGYPGVLDVSDSFRAGKREVSLAIRPEAEALGLSLEDLGRQVRAAFWGEEAQRIQRGRDEVKVMVRYPAEDRRSLADVERMRIRTPDGGEVPFGQVARVSYGRGYASIQRTDRRRTVNVTADVDSTQANANEILDALAGGVLPQLSVEHGVAWSFEGERKEQQDTLAGLGRGFALALLAIYALMAVPFRSYLQPLVVMTAVPFGLVGAVFGHVLLGMELSVLSLVGIVALAGVVVNDSLVLVDYLNRAHQQGLPLAKAVREAGVARFRPVLLTSLTTFAGLLPMILEKSVQAAFLIPMAVSLAFGVLFSTAITLVLVPAGTLMLDDVRRLAGRLRPRAAEPEPAGARPGAP